MSRKLKTILGIGFFLGIFLGVRIWSSHWGESRVTVVNRGKIPIQRTALIDPQLGYTELGGLSPGEKRTRFFRPQGEGSVRIRIETTAGSAEKIVIGYISPPHSEEDVAVIIDQDFQIQVWEHPYKCRENERVGFRWFYPHPEAPSKNTLYLADNQPLNKVEMSAVAQVLRFYQIDFEVTPQRINVSCKIWNDETLMANLSAKAKDPQWLREHPAL